MWGNQIRKRQPHLVIKEISELQAQFETNMIFFADLSFNADRTHALSICDQLAALPNRPNWYGLCRPDHLDAELVQAMANAGCSKVSVGIEALDDYTLSRIKPKQTLNVNLVRQNLAIVEQSPIFVRAFMMIGYPWQSREDLEILKDQLPDLPIDELRIGIFTPLPGSAIFSEYRESGLLLHEDFSKYTTEEPVIKLNGMTSEELLSIRLDLFETFYGSSAYKERLKIKIETFPWLAESYTEFRDALKI